MLELEVLLGSEFDWLISDWTWVEFFLRIISSLNSLVFFLLLLQTVDQSMFSSFVETSILVLSIATRGGHQARSLYSALLD